MKNFTELVSAALPEAAQDKPLELWFQDEARVGQQGTLTRLWARNLPCQLTPGVTPPCGYPKLRLDGKILSSRFIQINIISTRLGMKRHEQGNQDVQEFYNKKGWHEERGKPVDTKLFGIIEDGPIRIALHRDTSSRIERALAPDGRIGALLELGCGGNPELSIATLAEHYQGVDFSNQGLALAARRLTELGVDFTLQEADITSLPFEDESFDAVYSAHVFYHIDSQSGQEAALAEALRVLRPGSTAVFVLANPFPLLFPLRLLRRLGAAILRRGGGGPLPYLPLRPGWYARRARNSGDVEVVTANMASTWFNRNVSEYKGLGRVLWRTLAWLQTTFPKASVYLGNSFLLIVTKRMRADAD